MSYVNIKRKLCVVREEAGMSQKELVEYANKRQNEKMKEINVTIQQIKNYETEKTAIPVEILVLYAEVGKCLPSWFIDDSKESEWKSFLFKQKYGEEWVYGYDINGNLKKAIERYCAEENISIASFCNDDWFANKSSIGKLMGGEKGKINIEDAGRISEILKISFDELLLGEKEIINEIEKDAIAMMLISEKTRMKEKSLEEINRYAKTMKYLPSRIIDDSKESGIRNWFFRVISGEKDLYKDNITEFIGEKIKNVIEEECEGNQVKMSKFYSEHPKYSSVLKNIVNGKAVVVTMNDLAEISKIIEISIDKLFLGEEDILNKVDQEASDLLKHIESVKCQG